MDKFRVVLSPRAVKDLDAFSDVLCKRIAARIKVLEDNPFPRGKLIKKIKGKKSVFFRLRIDKYRIFYTIEPDRVVILSCLTKKDAERFIQNTN